jgi:hypothetical protein
VSPIACNCGGGKGAAAKVAYVVRFKDGTSERYTTATEARQVAIKRRGAVQVVAA